TAIVGHVESQAVMDIAQLVIISGLAKDLRRLYESCRVLRDQPLSVNRTTAQQELQKSCHVSDRGIDAAGGRRSHRIKLSATGPAIHQRVRRGRIRGLRQWLDVKAETLHAERSQQPCRDEFFVIHAHYTSGQHTGGRVDEILILEDAAEGV